MTAYWAEWALLPQGPTRGVRLVESGGRWASVDAGISRELAVREGCVMWDGVALPGFANCHSHAFHRALRGRTHGDGGTFWTWRERMYTVASQLNPENYLALARAVYCEMALAGMTAVGEFHYVHHQPDGSPYADPNAMGAALREAARQAGIRLTLLDTCYLRGGLTADGGHVPLSAEQRRFGDGDVAGWARRHELLQADAANDENTVIGSAIHSVRAVEKADVAAILAVSEGEPLHAHVSEQPAENAAAQGFYGSTPVELLAAEGALNSNFSAVHATHLSQGDVDLLARGGTTACFCPTTERDLADGIGPARALQDAGVGLSLGSDQHAIIDMFEEARALEMHERLQTNERGRFTPEDLLTAMTRHSTIGWADAGELAAGRLADVVVVSRETPRTAGVEPGQIMLAATASDITDVVSSGRHVVKNGQHVLGDVGAALAGAIGEFRE